MTSMTLDQFRATGRDCDDLGTMNDDEGMDGRIGRVYCDVLTIERPNETWPTEARQQCEAEGGWYLQIGNCEWFGSLADLEARLYEFARDEEIA
jgi:hypothetical protein